MQKYLRLLNVFESSSPKGFDAKIFLLRFAQRVFFHKNLQRLKPTLSGEEGITLIEDFPVIYSTALELLVTPFVSDPPELYIAGNFY